MDQLHCPSCQSTKVSRERRLQKPGTDDSIGIWRIGCAYWAIAGAALFGVALFLLGRYWLEPALAEAANLIALFTLVFVVGLVVLTWYYSRWSTVEQYVCSKCGHTWATETNQTTAAPT